MINYEFPPIGAGAATATYHIGKELAAMGHEVNVLTSGYKNLPRIDVVDGMNVFRCPALRKKKSESNVVEMLSFVVSAFIIMPILIKQKKIKGIIVFFGLPCGPLGLWANVLFNIPYVISLRGGDVPGTEKSLVYLHRVLMPLRRIIYKKSRAVVANSEGLKAISQKADPVPTIVIPNGIDTSYFKPSQKHIEKDYVSFIYVGRLSEQKNLLFLIEQFSILKNEIKEPFTINIVGDGPMKEKLQLCADSLGLSDRITWHGWLTKKRILELLQESDCLINPSLYEGMPNAVLEALACGLPVIASNVTGNNAVVVHGENGFLFNHGDYWSVNDFLKIIIKNSELRLNLGINARKGLINNSSWTKTAMEYLMLIDGFELTNKGFSIKNA